MSRPAPLALGLLLATAALAVPAPTTLGPVAGEIAGVYAHPLLRDGFAGALVLALGRGETRAGLVVEPYDDGRRPELYALNADKLLAPASVLKLFTAAAALETLGPDYRCVTRVVAGAPVAGQVGELFLVGAGDPALSLDDLAALAGQLRARGVTAVDRVVGDATRYNDRWGAGWTVDDLPWYYAAEVTALTLQRNHVDLLVAPATAGELARVTTSPPTDYLQVDNQVVTVPAGQPTRVVYDRRPDRPTVTLRGTIAVGQAPRSEGVAIPEPERWAAHELTRRLTAAGITVARAPEVGAAPAGLPELARLSSPPVSELLQRLLKNSDNLYAELLLREVGVMSAGRGTAEGGLHGVRAFLRANAIDPARLRLEDGSGLSRYNLVTCRAVAAVLQAMAGHRHSRYFAAALPLAGRDGTLATRFRGTAAEGNVRAKTGSYSNHSALAGYLTTGSGDVLVAVSLLNHSLAGGAELRRLHDLTFAALAAWRR